MITYNDIYEAARKERYSDRLQTISKKFVSEVAIYLKEKGDVAQRDNGVFSGETIKTKKQLENAITLFRELMLRRRKKILALVLIAGETGISKMDFDNMFGFERDLFEEIMKCVEASDKKVNELLNGAEDGSIAKNELVIFVEDLTEFMGMNGENIGPFEKGQIANLPSDISKLLVEDGKCEKVIE